MTEILAIRDKVLKYNMQLFPLIPPLMRNIKE